MSPEHEPKGIIVNMAEGGDVVLNYPSGKTRIIKKDKKISSETPKRVFEALDIMKLTLPLAFPELLGVDQDSAHRVKEEEKISNLPGGSEQDYRDALKRAGSILQGDGWEVGRVADFLIWQQPNMQAAKELDTIKEDQVEAIKNRLRDVIVQFYPGAGSSMEKARKRKYPR
jgi:hypothetical protein